MDDNRYIIKGEKRLERTINKELLSVTILTKDGSMSRRLLPNVFSRTI